MSKPFEIKFDFPVADSRLRISINATAELHYSDRYYLVTDFHVEKEKHPVRQHSIFPDQEIKYIKRDGSGVWVHEDSERESLLSLAIGKGIEKAMEQAS
jgi:hypothetical protein